MQAQFSFPNYLSTYDLQSWSSSQLFQLIWTYTFQLDANHSEFVSIHEQQKQQFMVVSEERDWLWDEKAQVEKQIEDISAKFQQMWTTIAEILPNALEYFSFFLTSWLL